LVKEFFAVAHKRTGTHCLTNQQTKSGDTGFEGQKTKSLQTFFGQKWYISLPCPDDPLHPIVTKIGRVGGMDKVIQRTVIDVNWLIGVGCGVMKNGPSPSNTT
jgi:hypothetical protein